MIPSSWNVNISCFLVDPSGNVTSSSALHPASTSHRQLSDEELIAAGVQPEMIRASIGIENIDDIIEDLEAAFTAVMKEF